MGGTGSSAPQEHRADTIVHQHPLNKPGLADQLASHCILIIKVLQNENRGTEMALESVIRSLMVLD